MTYSTLGFLETLRQERRTRFTTEFVDPLSSVKYGYLFKFWPIAILNVTGWHGESLKVVKIFNREWVWQ